jgi:hypothetical protein
MVGDHSMSRPAASCSFQRSTTALASARGPVGGVVLGAGLDVEPSCTNPHGADYQLAPTCLPSAGDVAVAVGQRPQPARRYAEPSQ